MIKELFRSKKFIMTVVGVLVGLANRIFDLGMNVDELMAALSPIIAYIIGQGIADNGKERAKTEADAIMGLRNTFTATVDDDLSKDVGSVIGG